METVVSCGTRTQINDSEWRLGKSGWSSQDGEPGQTILSKDGKLVTGFEIGETIRPGVSQAIDQLQNRGKEIRILSGDPNRERVVKIGKQLRLSLSSIYSSQSAEEKAIYIAENSPEKTLFVGDGGNDSFALDSAACSGSPATGIRAVEGRSDFVFMDRNFQAIELLLFAAEKRRATVRLIFLITVLYNFSAIALCLAGQMNPLLAAVLMPISSLVTTFVATRV